MPAQLRAEGGAPAEPNPPPRTYARHFAGAASPAFLWQIRALNPPRQEAAVPRPPVRVRACGRPLLIVGEHDVIAHRLAAKMFQTICRMRTGGSGRDIPLFRETRRFNRLVLEFFAEWGHRPYNP